MAGKGTAGEQCPCGALITLSLDADGNGRAWGKVGDEELQWFAEALGDDVGEREGESLTEEANRVLNAAINKGVFTNFVERAIAETMTFTPTTVCDCGRRYRAIPHKPWIEPVEADDA